MLKLPDKVTLQQQNICDSVNRLGSLVAALEWLVHRTSMSLHCQQLIWRSLYLSLEAVGLNPIFSYRVDERVHHGDDVTKRLGKSEEPDRVYGLRQTRNIENLLYDGVKRKFQDNRAIELQVHEVLGLRQPLTQTGDRLLFPFLVLEAKSASSSCSWHRIQLQTAFSIRTFLHTQNLLRAATGRHLKRHLDPLVWFLANRGEDWRLYAAYMEPASTTSHTIGTFEYASTHLSCS